MTKKQRIRQLEKRKNIATGVITIAMGTAALLFCNCMGSTGDDVDFTEETNTEVVEVVEVETETEILFAAVEAPIVEEPSEWEEFETEEIEIEENEVETTSKKNDDLSELAHLIYAESGSDSMPDEALYYTGAVVLNRVNSDKYPNTIHKVINQKGQYSVSGYYMKKTPTQRCWDIAQELLDKGPQEWLEADYVGQSGYGTYKRYGSRTRYIKVKNLYFFALK